MTLWWTAVLGALAGATVGLAAGVPGLVAGGVIGTLAGLLAGWALDTGDVHPRHALRTLGGLRGPWVTFRARTQRIARVVGGASLLLGLIFSATCLLVAALGASGDDLDALVVECSTTSAVLILLGFAVLSASSRPHPRFARSVEHV